LFFGCRKPICGPFAIWMMMGIPAFMTFMGWSYPNPRGLD
jgi:hypothetical protein